MSRKSTQVRLSIVGAIAAVTMAGCGGTQQASFNQVGRCVDQNGRVLPDSACEGGSSGYLYPHWVYGGSVYRSGRLARSRSGEIGGYVRGASSSPMSGATIVSRSGTVIRGGFGRSGVGGGRSFGGRLSGFFHGVGG